MTHESCPPSVRAALVLDGVAVRRRGRDVVVVDRLRFDRGSHVLAGANGSGKSTLLAGIAGLLPVDGLVTVGGQDVTSGAGRRSVAYLPQAPSGLDHLTALDAVRFAQAVVGLAAADPVAHLETVGMADRARSRVGRLSGGERRLVYLATLLTQRAPVFLLDEPTVGLDAAHRLALRDVLRRIAAEAVVVTATHVADDLDDLADRIVVLSDGRVVHDGPGADLRDAAPDGPSWDRALTALAVAP
ncbi:ATP-binding cassette domain-containing protein [Luteimicrobium subarcticum]|nr:ABC transporter ATP-binding protein [Luteimicrobium subarcticum]